MYSSNSSTSLSLSTILLGAILFFFFPVSSAAVPEKKKNIYLYPNNQLMSTEVTIKYTHQHETNSENAMLNQNVTNYFAE